MPETARRPDPLAPADIAPGTLGSGFLWHAVIALWTAAFVAPAVFNVLAWLGGGAR